MSSLSVPQANQARANTPVDLNLYYSTELGNQLQTQRTNVLIAGGFAIAVLGLSILSSWYLFKTNSFGGTALEYMKLGPAAISSLALPFPIRMFLSYRVRRPIYVSYKRQFDMAVATGCPVQPELYEDTRAALKALHKID